MKAVWFAVFAVLLPIGTAYAQQVCPCVPISHVLSVETFETWNCAASAMIIASGSPYVVTMPAPSNDGRWLVVRRVNAGSYIPAPDAPYLIETFDGADGAMARFMSVASDRFSTFLAVADGKFVVVIS